MYLGFVFSITLGEEGVLKRSFLVVLFSLLPCVAMAAPLVLNTENWYPYNFEKDGKVTGMSTEIVEKGGESGRC